MAASSTLTGIVIGSSIVGLCVGTGLYFGLRSRAAPASPPTATTDAAPAPSEGALATPSPPATVRPPQPSSAVVERARAEAAAQFEEARADLVKKCWTPALANPGPPTTEFRMHVLLDAEGKQLGRSFLEGAVVRPGVGQCVNLRLPPIHVSAPGARITLDVPLGLP